ncbi:hypothetical protein C5167_029330 [Papaver somniferum]|nr:hypothetical protein C5167_029330 [Papaver somniferum]
MRLFVDDSPRKKVLFPTLSDESKNFLARIADLKFLYFDNPSDVLELRFWASYRGQILVWTGNSSCT